jgi:hypothetical protein
MLRITVSDDEKAAIFKMEGKLTDEWVCEAEKTWTAFSGNARGNRIVVDLCGVSFVDDAGRELLARMHAAGALLVGTGPMTGALIDEICGKQRQSTGKWIRHVFSLFFLALFVLLVCCGRTVSDGTPVATQAAVSVA